MSQEVKAIRQRNSVSFVEKPGAKIAVVKLIPDYFLEN